jgi:hypothetical protein
MPPNDALIMDNWASDESVFGRRTCDAHERIIARERQPLDD